MLLLSQSGLDILDRLLRLIHAITSLMKPLKELVIMLFEFVQTNFKSLKASFLLVGDRFVTVNLHLACMLFELLSDLCFNFSAKLILNLSKSSFPVFSEDFWYRIQGSALAFNQGSVEDVALVVVHVLEDRCFCVFCDAISLGTTGGGVMSLMDVTTISRSNPCITMCGGGPAAPTRQDM